MVALVLLATCNSKLDTGLLRILWVKTDFLHPTTRGGQIRTLETLKRLHARHEVHYVAYDNPAQPEGLQRAREYCSHAYPLKLDVPPRRSLKFAGQLATNLFSGLPLSITRYCSAAMRDQIAHLIRTLKFDSLVCDFLTPAPNFPDMGQVTLFQHNVETMIWRRHVDQSPDPLRKAYFRSQAERMFRCERDMCRAAARVIAVSPQDAALMQQMFGVDAVSVPTGVDLDFFRRPAAPLAQVRRATRRQSLLGSAPLHHALLFPGHAQPNRTAHQHHPI